MLGFTAVLILWKVTCCADGDDQGSSDSFPEQAKLKNLLVNAVTRVFEVLQLTIGLRVVDAHAELPILPIS
jgi:hypothetical protein